MKSLIAGVGNFGLTRFVFGEMMPSENIAYPGGAGVEDECRTGGKCSKSLECRAVQDESGSPSNLHALASLCIMYVQYNVSFVFNSGGDEVLRPSQAHVATSFNVRVLRECAAGLTCMLYVVFIEWERNVR